MKVRRLVLNKNKAAYVTLDELSNAAAELVVKVANEAIVERGGFKIALAGGATPKRLHQVLSSPGYREATDWSAWHIFFGDERVVPLDDADSNFGMARTSFLGNVPIPVDNVHVPPVDAGAPGNAAQQYEADLRKAFVDEDVPRFDVILLGLGSDGHTASLFPGRPALDVQDRLVTDSSPGVLPPPVDRITFTFPLINAARHVVFLAGGADKKEAFKAAYDGVPLGEVGQVPANRVVLKDGEVHWLITSELDD
jgi:6-phosphogluconolactonase